MAEFSRASPPKCLIVRDVGDNEKEGSDLQDAFESKAKHIIIEPFNLGEVTVRWIRVGNFFHKISVVTGVVSLNLMYFDEDKKHIYIPLGCMSVLAACFYATSSNDPCCKYQPECSSKSLDKLPLREVCSANPIILVRRDDTRRKWLHNCIALTTGGLCAWKIYQHFFKN